MRLYLCGPMTGIKQYNFPKFMEEAKRLRDAGYDVVNPAEHAVFEGFDPIAYPDIVCTKERRREFIENDKNLLDECDGMAMIEGWQSSEGCIEEQRHFSKQNKPGIRIMVIQDWIRIAFENDPGAIIPVLPPDRTEQFQSIRTFSTGATRDTDTNKLDFDGFLCPLVLERYAEYMNANRKMADGSVRSSSNWKSGIPQEVYRKSGWRHFFSFWKHCLSGNKALAMVDACALLFNVMGWMHEELKNDNNRTA